LEARAIMSSSEEWHGGVPVDHSRQIPRLRRIEGQVRGLQQMIETGRDCVDVAHQINAVVAALRRVQGDMLCDHLKAISAASITGDLPEEERRRLADEVGQLLTKLI
jgi:CsoR family transcriptional regulator, copper-sensing transcriptional repressor